MKFKQIITNAFIGLFLLGVMSWPTTTQAIQLTQFKQVVASEQITSNGKPLLIQSDVDIETYKNAGHARVFTLECVDNAGVGQTLSTTFTEVIDLYSAKMIWFNHKTISIISATPIVGIYTCQLIITAFSEALNGDGFIFGGVVNPTISILQSP